MNSQHRDINVIFFGTPEFAAIGLQQLIDAGGITVGAVVAQPDRPAGRGGKLAAPPVKKLALTHNIPVLQPRSLRRELQSFHDFVDAHGPFDIGVVIAFGQILPEEVFTAPKSGCVNIHASLLPRWRGAAPIQRAIMAGDSETGVCLMEIGEGLDEGGVFAREALQIHDDDTFLTMHDALAEAGAKLLVEHLTSITTGELSATPQPEEGITYASKIENDQAHINWSAPATEIQRQIRGLSPFPGAFTYLGDTRLKIYSAVEAGDTPSLDQAIPGTIVDITSEALLIRCGTGAIAVEDLQLAGKRRMSVAEFLPGAHVEVGTTLRDNQQ